MAKIKAGNVSLTNQQSVMVGDVKAISETRVGGFSSLVLDLTPTVSINRFSTDGTLTGNSNATIPTERAIKTYVDAHSGGIDITNTAVGRIIIGTGSGWAEGNIDSTVMVYSPTNYTPSNSSLSGHLTGINNRLVDLTAPGPIGGTTPSSGTFTTVTATTTITSPTLNHRRVFTATVDHSFVAGQVGYLSVAGTITRAIGNTEETIKNLLVMATASITGGSAGIFSLWGEVPVSAHGFSLGIPLFVSQTTPGGLTAVLSSVDEDYGRVVGYPLTTDIILFRPSGVWTRVFVES